MYTCLFLVSCNQHKINIKKQGRINKMRKSVNINPAFFSNALHKESPSKSVFIGTVMKKSTISKKLRCMSISIHRGRNLSRLTDSILKKKILSRSAGKQQSRLNGTSISRLEKKQVQKQQANVTPNCQQKLIQRHHSESIQESQQGTKQKLLKNTQSSTFDRCYRKVVSKCEQSTIHDKFKQIKPNKETLNILNQQMFDSVKGYLKKLQKGKAAFAKHQLQNMGYGLDIKAFERKSSQYPEQQSKKLKPNTKQKKRASFIFSTKRVSTSTDCPSSIKSFQQLEKLGIRIKTQHQTYHNSEFDSEKKHKNHDPNQKLSKIKGELISHYQKCHPKQQRTVQYRFQAMLKNCKLILNSFKVITHASEKTNQQQQTSQNIISSQKSLQTKTLPKLNGFNRLPYFVGFGNNKNLVRSIMKKRWWWVEVDDIYKAAFVWTQLRIQPISNKLKQFCQLHYPQNGDSYQKKTVSNNSKLFFRNNGFQYKHKQFMLLQTLPSVIHNHFQNNFIFGNKNALFHGLKKYFDYMGNDIFSIIPKTFYFEKQNEALQGIKHQNDFDLNMISKKCTWILKPAENSNRGQGISVHPNIESVMRKIQQSKCTKFIVQEYLKNPFLYQKRKFDIRTYMAMITIGKVTKFMWYKEGYLRTSCQKFRTGNLENVFVHLTNDAIQKYSQKYGRFEPGNKISYNQFQRYLDMTYTAKGYSVDSLTEKMKAIARTTVKAIYPKVIPQQTYFSFELFGLDFLIDSKFEPLLLEVNTNPCLQLSCPVLERIIPRMLENLYRFGLDPVFQPPSKFIPRVGQHFIYDNFFDKNNFELIFDSQSDRDLVWERQCLCEPQITYQDNTEVFLNDGKQMQPEKDQYISNSFMNIFEQT